MTLSDHHSALVEAACDHVLATGAAFRANRCDATLTAYAQAVSYLRTLLDKLVRSAPHEPE